MKKFFFIQLLIISNNFNSQIYNLFYQEFKNGDVVIDTTATYLANGFIDSYAGKEYSKAITYLDSLTIIGKGDHKIFFNKAICYAKSNAFDSCSVYIQKYLNSSNSKIKIGMLTHSILNETIERNPNLKKQCDLLTVEKCQNLFNCEFALDLEYRDAREQEILMDSIYANNRNRMDRYKRLKENFDPILKILKEQGLPTKKEIGSTVHLLEIMILHMDYNPKMQYKIATKMFKVADKKGYNISTLAYAIDRSLKNQNKKQKYGSIILNRGSNKAEIYPYKGSLKKINKKRAKIGIVPIEVELKNIQINQYL